MGFVYAGMDTCAACNLCSLRCPVGIETGTMIMGKRAEKRGNTADRVAALAASATGAIETGFGLAAGAQTLARGTVGNKAVDSVAGALNSWSKGRLPRPGKSMRARPRQAEGHRNHGDTRPRALFPGLRLAHVRPAEKPILGCCRSQKPWSALLARAGYQPVVPEKLSGACCGQPFQSKGFPEEAEKLGRKLADTLDCGARTGRCRFGHRHVDLRSPYPRRMAARCVTVPSSSSIWCCHI